MNSASIPSRLPRSCHSFACAARDPFAVASGKCIDWSQVSTVTYVDEGEGAAQRCLPSL